MPFKTFEEYAQAEGYCCPLTLLHDRTAWSTEALAEDSGVTRRAVGFWRQDFAAGKVACKRAPNCALVKALERLQSFQGQTTP